MAWYALVARQAIPAIYYLRAFSQAGGLLSYGNSLTDMYRQVGIYTGRVHFAPRWLSDGDACAGERAADALHCRWIDAEPVGNDPYARPPTSRQSRRPPEAVSLVLESRNGSTDSFNGHFRCRLKIERRGAAISSAERRPVAT